MEKVKDLQHVLKLEIVNLKNYELRIQEKIESKETALDDAQKLFERRNMIIKAKAFEDGTF